MSNKVLVAGASGLIGAGAVDAFLDAGWDVVGLSRHKPELPSGRSVAFVSADLRNEEAVRNAVVGVGEVTHLAYAAISEKADDLVGGWSDAGQIAANNTMLRNVVEALIAAKSPLKHISILQGTKAYGGHVRPMPVPARESDPRFDHPNFFLDQEDYVRGAGTRYGFAYTALRPQLVTGKTPGALNVLPAIGVYAAIRREKGELLGFPGGPAFVWEAADADLLGRVIVWAAQAPEAANQVFNVTNGDVFEWRNVWPAIAETLGVMVGPDEPTSVAAYIRDNADIWSRIADKYGLKSRDLRDVVGQGDQHADFSFAYGASAAPVVFVSTVKLRKTGFNAAVDTRDAFQGALKWMIDQKLLPPAQG